MSLCCPICEGDDKFCKENGCQDHKEKKETFNYKRLKSLATSSGAEFYPVNLTGQAKIIQGILNK